MLFFKTIRNTKPKTNTPRIPLDAVLGFPAKQQTIQVNHCRNPNSKSYGVPGQTKRQKPDPNPTIEPTNRKSPTNGGFRQFNAMHAVKARRFDRTRRPSRKLSRLIGQGPLRTLEKRTVCVNTGSVKHAHSVAHHRHV